MVDKVAEGMDEAGRDAPRYEWVEERVYWSNNYLARPYVTVDRAFSYYEPAYRYGVDAAHRYRGQSWDQIEANLDKGWESPGQHWSDIKDAVRDAWDRVTGYFDK